MQKVIAIGIAFARLVGTQFSDAQQTQRARAFIDYFMPTSMIGVLSGDVWGAATIGPHDPRIRPKDVTSSVK